MLFKFDSNSSRAIWVTKQVNNISSGPINSLMRQPAALQNIFQTLANRSAWRVTNAALPLAVGHLTSGDPLTLVWLTSAKHRSVLAKPTWLPTSCLPALLTLHIRRLKVSPWTSAEDKRVVHKSFHSPWGSLNSSELKLANNETLQPLYKSGTLIAIKVWLKKRSLGIICSYY